MKPIQTPLVLIVSLGALAFAAACRKSETPSATGSAANEKKAGQPARRGNSAEALGFASASEADYFSSRPSAGGPGPATGTQEQAAEKANATGAPITRTLRATDGRSVEAVLLSRTDSAVKIRRKADGAEFVVPFENLSKADRAFIATSAVPRDPGG